MSTFSGKLSVVAKEARGLTRANVRGSADPFLRISAGTMPKRFTQSESAHDTLSPSWNHRLDVNFDADIVVLVEVLSKDVVGSAVQMGYVEVPIAEFSTTAIDRWFQLKRPKNPYDPHVTVFGEVHLTLSFIERRIASTVSVKPVDAVDALRVRSFLGSAGQVKDYLETGLDEVIAEYADIDGADRAITMSGNATVHGTEIPIVIAHSAVLIEEARAAKEARARIEQERLEAAENQRRQDEIGKLEAAKQQEMQQRLQKMALNNHWKEYVRMLNQKQSEFDGRREQLTRKYFEAAALEKETHAIIKDTDKLRASRYNGKIVKQGFFLYLVEESKLRLIGSPEVLADWGLNGNEAIDAPPGVVLTPGFDKPRKADLLKSEFQIMEAGQARYLKELHELQAAIATHNERERLVWTPYEGQLMKRESEPGVVYWVRNHEACPMDLVKLQAWGWSPENVQYCTVLDVLPVGQEVQDRAIEESRGPTPTWRPVQGAPSNPSHPLDGQLVVVPGTAAYYYVFEGTRHQVDTVELCTLYGWQIALATQQPAEVVHAIPEGIHLDPAGTFVHEQTNSLPGKMKFLREQRELHERLTRELIYLEEKIRHRDRSYFEGRVVRYPASGQQYLMAGCMKNPGSAATFADFDYDAAHIVDLPEDHRLPTWAEGPEITEDRDKSRLALQYALAVNGDQVVQEEAKMEGTIKERLAAYSTAKKMYEDTKTWVEQNLAGSAPGIAGGAPVAAAGAPAAPPPAAAPAGPKVFITSAEYGRKETFSKKIVDVRVKLQQIVDAEGKINLPAGFDYNSWAGDPCPGKVKELKVVYTVDGRKAEATYKEKDAIRIP